MAEFTYRSNRRNVENALNEAVERTLIKIGLYAEGKIKEKITEEDIIDSGYMRNSVDNKVDMEKKMVAVGTNTEYAIYQHEGTRYIRGKPFIKNTVFEEINNITRISEEELRRGMD